MTTPLRALLAVGLLAVALAGCAHLPPRASPRCELTGYPIVVGAGEQTVAATGTPTAPTLRAVLPSLLADLRVARRDQPNDRVLVLSGGSLNGAFGAGLFKGLPAIPRYQVVTAVSTGALQSTFIFLANEKVPRKRYPAYFRADPLLGKPGDSYPTDLALAYAVGREGDLIKVNRLSYVGAAIGGSLATFDPLHATLRDLITVETLDQVASEYTDHHRSLLVAAADLEDGVGYALDLTKLAVEAKTNGDLQAATSCYIDAILASASVPPGVPPVSLTVNGRTHIFMDGGARFGVFFQQVRDEVDRTPNVDIDLVVNGALIGGPWLEKGQPVKRWSIINFGLRAVDLLENEVYRFSVNDVARWGAKQGTLHLAFISNAGLRNLTVSPGEFDFRGKSCDTAHEEDARQKPQEFYPGYMRCLIAYGQARGTSDPWNPATAIDQP